MNKSIRLLVLLDWRPGHVSQVEGLVAALERKIQVEVDRLPTRPRVIAHRKIRQWSLKYLKRHAARLLWLFFAIDVQKLIRPDVILASARPTIVAGSLLARHFNVPFVYSGFARHLSAGDMDLMLVGAPGFETPIPLSVIPIPGAISPDRLPAPRLITVRDDLAGASIGLLLGGKANTHHYRGDEWLKIRDALTELEKKTGATIRLSNSRRTPKATSSLFSAWAKERETRSFIDYRTAGPSSAEAVFAADALLVTEDSLSMLSEGLNAMRPVIALRPDAVKPSWADKVVAHMAASGSLMVLPIAELECERLIRELTLLKPPREDRRAAIAAPIMELLQRWRLLS